MGISNITDELIVGIDLGTTNSCVSYWKDNNLVVIPDDKGNKRARDYAFALQLIYEEGVSIIPCSPFYDEENVYDRTLC